MALMSTNDAYKESAAKHSLREPLTTTLPPLSRITTPGPLLPKWRKKKRLN
ncbi:hypothetical protein CCACVL1_19926 [Corchorus capsularis]|uniref:Uncharacterized protein n=1 Tax=Corchorus capsularis TaxID=210143 RepID=A0A1R3HDV7_COCAP|nr:hypothetical protein CCACVL1_19926 [Corchorus capsularis]